MVDGRALNHDEMYIFHALQQQKEKNIFSNIVKSSQTTEMWLNDAN